MKKMIPEVMKAILLPLGLGTLATLILYFFVKINLMNSVEYVGVAMLIISTIYFFAGNLKNTRMAMVKENPIESSMMVTKKEDVLRDRENLLSHQAKAVLWGVVGFLFLASPLFFWKG